MENTLVLGGYYVLAMGYIHSGIILVTAMAITHAGTLNNIEHTHINKTNDIYHALRVTKSGNGPGWHCLDLARMTSVASYTVGCTFPFAEFSLIESKGRRIPTPRRVTLFPVRSCIWDATGCVLVFIDPNNDNHGCVFMGCLVVLEGKPVLTLY
jgi:hypothetical protein